MYPPCEKGAWVLRIDGVLAALDKSLMAEKLLNPNISPLKISKPSHPDDAVALRGFDASSDTNGLAGDGGPSPIIGLSVEYCSIVFICSMVGSDNRRTEVYGRIEVTAARYGTQCLFFLFSVLLGLAGLLIEKDYGCAEN